jgi:hypothetical protein
LFLSSPGSRVWEWRAESNLKEEIRARLCDCQFGDDCDYQLAGVTKNPEFPATTICTGKTREGEVDNGGEKR